MEDRFWAKSNQETIVEHTKNLLKKYQLLKELYPKIPMNWQLLELACKYHDLGKMNHFFQEKIRDHSKIKIGEIPHGLLSIQLIPAKELKKQFPLTEVQALIQAVALHHDRDFSSIDPKNYAQEIENLNSSSQTFPYVELGLLRPAKIKQLSGRFYELDIPVSSSDPSFHSYVMLKGLLNKIDYAASGYYLVEYPANFLENNMTRMLEKWKKQSADEFADWNPMQNYAHEHQNDNLLVLGQTGLGKTEAGLRWIGNHKAFFTLPLKTAINAIYQRIAEDIADSDKITEQVGILHSDSFAVLLNGKKEILADFESMESYLNDTKSWSFPLTITTLDQTFDFVYHYRGFESKLATFSYSKIVIDEIQMYSPDLLAYLLKGLKEIQKYGGKFMIMTATMPEYLIELFKKNEIQLVYNKQPFLDNKLLERHYLQVIPDQLQADDVITSYQNNKVLVICNTIRKAKEIYNELKEELPKGITLNLLHSQFTRGDRQQKEKDILEFAKSTDTGIWVATQVVEASLDIDFDILLTELSELNGLFQRMGRCYRKRRLKNKHKANVFVFNGGDSVTSGIGKREQAVVQQEIFNIAKEALGEFKGIMTENQKMDLIANAYSTERMKRTKYYERINNMVDWLEAIENDQKSKKEVQKLFRNINTREVIPETIYHENQAEIDRLLVILKTPMRRTSSAERKKLHEQKTIAKVLLGAYMLSVQEYIFREAVKNDQIRSVRINRYNQIDFIDGEYTSKSGFYPKKSINYEDHFF